MERGMFYILYGIMSQFNNKKQKMIDEGDKRFRFKTLTK
jgi:hypothetical protein